MQYHLKNLTVPVKIGVYGTEKIKPQNLLVNVYFQFEATKASVTDDLSDTIDYSQIEALVKRVCLTQHYQLLEKLQAVIISEIETNFSNVQNIEVSLEKFPFETGSIVVK